MTDFCRESSRISVTRWLVFTCPHVVSSCETHLIAYTCSIRLRRDFWWWDWQTVVDVVRRMCSLEALLPEDPEKHLQLHRSRLTSSVVLRGETTTYCECRGHAHARKARHVQEEMTQGTLVRSDKARARASTARAKAQGSKDSKNSKTRTRTSANTKDPNECWNCGLRGHFSKDSWSKKDAQN